MNATTHDTTLLTRPAMRFILRHHRGTLASLNNTTGQMVECPIHYEADAFGQLIGYVPADDALVDAVHAKATITLTVTASDGPTGAAFDETGMPTEFGIDRICASVETTILEQRTQRIGRQHESVAVVKLEIYDIDVTIRDEAA